MVCFQEAQTNRQSTVQRRALCRRLPTCASPVPPMSHTCATSVPHLSLTSAIPIPHMSLTCATPAHTCAGAIPHLCLCLPAHTGNSFNLSFKYASPRSLFSFIRLLRLIFHFAFHMFINFYLLHFLPPYDFPFIPSLFLSFLLLFSFFHSLHICSPFLSFSFVHFFFFSLFFARLSIVCLKSFSSGLVFCLSCLSRFGERKKRRRGRQTHCEVGKYF